MANNSSTPKAPDTAKKIRGLRTFAADQAKVKDTPEKAAPTVTEPPVVDTAPAEPLPVSAPIKAHENVTRLDASGDRIPAFHEIETDEKAETTSILEDKTKIALDDEDGAFGGTVITDTKAARFNLFSSIGSDISGWWKGITAKRKKEAQTYAVPDSSLRKGVIQKATSKTGTTFTADSQTLRERIKQRQQAKPATDEPETTWSANTETGFDLLEAPEATVPTVTTPTNVAVTFKKISTPMPDAAPVAPIVTTPVTEPAVPVLDPVPKSEPEEVIAEPLPPPVPEPMLPTPPMQVATPVVTQAAVTTAAPKPRRHIGPWRITDFSTNILTMTILVALIGFALIFVISKVVLSVFNLTETPVETVMTDTQLLTNATAQTMLLSDLTLPAITESLQVSASRHGNTVQEISFYLAADAPLLPARFFTIIEAQVEPAFIQNINHVHMAVSNQPTRALLISAKDAAAIRGGLLQWESTMYPAVNKLFATPIGTVSSGFVDEQIDGTDVRVLYSTDNTPLIVYGFITGSTVAITSNHTQFRTVIQVR